MVQDLNLRLVLAGVEMNTLIVDMAFISTARALQGRMLVIVFVCRVCTCIRVVCTWAPNIAVDAVTEDCAAVGMMIRDFARCVVGLATLAAGGYYVVEVGLRVLHAAMELVVTVHDCGKGAWIYDRDLEDRVGCDLRDCVCADMGFVTSDAAFCAARRGHVVEGFLFRVLAG